MCSGLVGGGLVRFNAHGRPFWAPIPQTKFSGGSPPAWSAHGRPTAVMMGSRSSCDVFDVSLALRTRNPQDCAALGAPSTWQQALGATGVAKRGCCLGRSQMGGSNIGVRGRFGQSGPVSEASVVQQAHVTKPPPCPPRARPKAEAFGQGLVGPYAHIRGFRNHIATAKACLLPQLYHPLFDSRRFRRCDNLR